MTQRNKEKILLLQINNKKQNGCFKWSNKNEK